MVWDKSQPQDTTKLRRLGIVTRPNWEAIETADKTLKPHGINFADRNAAGVPADPTAITDAVILYSKKDGAGKPQLYSIDPDSNVVGISTNQVTNSANTGTGGGTIYKTEMFLKDGKRYVTYAGLTTAAVGSATILFPENFTTVISAQASANFGFARPVGIVALAAGATIYRGVELTGAWYSITGIIA